MSVVHFLKAGVKGPLVFCKVCAVSLQFPPSKHGQNPVLSNFVPFIKKAKAAL